MKTSFVAFSIVLLVATLSSDVHGQAFVNDNDGLLDVGEAPGFPADPAGATGELEFFRQGIQDLDGTNLLVNLETLSLWGNHVTSIESGDFSGLTNLQTLYIGSNNIAKIEPDGFSGLTNLQRLELSGNSLTSIEPDGFNGLTNLQTLELSGNSLTSIEPDGFNGLTNLQTLDLQGNSLTSIEMGDFSGLTNLQTLNIASNNIASIETDGFSGLTNLQRLVLWNNHITSIEPGDFNGLTNLQSLVLGENSLTSIESGTFAESKELQTLILFDNGLTELNFTGATFDNLQPSELVSLESSLTGLWIGENQITALVLDDAELSQSSFDAIVGETTSIIDVSFVGLTFSDSNPIDLSALLGIPTLDIIRIDQSLYNLYAAELNAFAAIAGNTVTIVPEPSSTVLLVFASVLCLRYRSKYQRLTCPSPPHMFFGRRHINH